jgi:hypothetical protein
VVVEQAGFAVLFATAGAAFLLSAVSFGAAIRPPSVAPA